MEIRYDNKVCIFVPLSAKLDKRTCLRLFSKLSNEQKQIGLDLSYVQDCTIDFCEALTEVAKEKNIGIFNIPSDIFALFNIMNIDKCTNLFVSELDFEENSRRLIHRKFSFV